MATLSLTSLPFEIRATIFEQALRPSDCGDVRTTQGLSLLATSRQLYHETHLVPFHSNTLALPAICDSSVAATYELLRQMSWQQRHAVRKLNLQVTSSTLDVAAAVKVLRYLRMGNADGDLDSEIGAMSLPSYDGDLRDVTITISARDIAVPLADCTIELQQTLDVECCQIFAWLQTFRTLRNLQLHVRLCRGDQFSKTQQEELGFTLRSCTDSAVLVQTTFDIVGDDGYSIDELDMFPDSYLGLYGNVCPNTGRYIDHGL